MLEINMLELENAVKMSRRLNRSQLSIVDSLLAKKVQRHDSHHFV